MSCLFTDYLPNIVEIALAVFPDGREMAEDMGSLLANATIFFSLSPYKSGHLKHNLIYC